MIIRDIFFYTVLVNWFLGGVGVAYYIMKSSNLSDLDFKKIILSLLFGLYGYLMYTY